jgi:hypothetical protein
MQAVPVAVGRVLRCEEKFKGLKSLKGLMVVLNDSEVFSITGIYYEFHEPLNS